MILEASIRTFELDRVKVSLTRLGVTRLHISEAEHPTRGVQGTAAFLPRIRIRVTVPKRSLTRPPSYSHGHPKRRARSGR